jgi:shikimate kinase
MVKFCPNCESALRRTRNKLGEYILKCPNPLCSYAELYTRELNKKKKMSKTLEAKILASKILVFDGSEKKFDLRSKTHVECPKCGYNEAFYEQCQTMPTCEPATAFYQCTHCDHRWRDTESLVLIHSSKTKSNIALIGFMGVGKSTIGPELAKFLEKDFIELDHEIEKQVGVPIVQYVALNEANFRKLEKSFCQGLDSISNSVISCGGGIVLQSENIENLRKYSFVVGLEASIKTILTRINTDGIRQRPLLNSADPEESILKLLKIRNPLYKKAAHIIMNTDTFSTRQIIFKISDIYKEMVKNDQ